jgi:transcriptional regulator with XRE-family HTH domain
MLKTEAIQQLGGSMAAVAEAIGITPQAVSQWPEELPPRIEDRVIAAIARRAAQEQSGSKSEV